MTSAGSSIGCARVVADPDKGVAVGAGETGMAERTSGVSEAAGEAVFFGVFLAGEVFFFFFDGVGDFFFEPVFFRGEALGFGEGDLRGFGVGVGDGVALPVFFDFFLVDLAVGAGVGVADSVRGDLDGVSSPVWP